MVNPSRRDGQRRRRISLRMRRGRFGSKRMLSVPSAAIPAPAARRMNFLLLIGRRGNRRLSYDLLVRDNSLAFQNNPAEDIPIVEMASGQKLNVANRSMRRFAVVPGEYGNPTMLLDTPKNGEPKTPPGFARFTLLKALRKLIPMVRL